MNVLKRDGRIVQFNKEKIINAILKAFLAVDGEITDYASIKAQNMEDRTNTRLCRSRLNAAKEKRRC